MKKVLISAFVIVFLLGISLALADDKCPAAKSSAGCCAKGKTQTAACMSQKSETKVEDPHAGCPMKQVEQTATSAAAAPEAKIEAAQAAPAPAVTDEAKAAVEADAKVAGEMKVAEGSGPDVTGKNQLHAFHENLHPMHMALKESKYAEIREMYPKLKESSKGIAEYKCPIWDKCSDECKKDFETKKAGLLTAVDNLGEACKGEDNAKIDASFNVMHDAYIQFASKCAPAEKPKAEEAKAKDIKVEETK